MSRPISIASTTADGVSDVSEWFVSEGEHDQAARDLFRDVAVMLMGRPNSPGPRRVLDGADGTMV